ncbi:MAG: ANTAR domain-containing protein [Lachnospiraceae bacterium]|nr:ANTAR domain-containing protein [Lachnospiraceae bacterium]
MAEAYSGRCDVLVVSSSDKMNSFMSRVLPEYVTGDVVIKSSASGARRELLTRDYDLIIVNIPLTDETATNLAIDLSLDRGAMVMLISPADKYEDVYDRVAEYGIPVLCKPVNARTISRSVRLLAAIREKYRKTEKKAHTLEEKMDEIRIVNRAKLILIERDHISEDDAHRIIGKQAMDRGVSRRVIAEDIINNRNEAV